MMCHVEIYFHLTVVYIMVELPHCIKHILINEML